MEFYYLTTCWKVLSVVVEVKVILYCHIITLMQVLNIHIEDVTIAIHILLIQPKMYRK